MTLIDEEFNGIQVFESGDKRWMTPIGVHRFDGPAMIYYLGWHEGTEWWIDDRCVQVCDGS